MKEKAKKRNPGPCLEKKHCGKDRRWDKRRVRFQLIKGRGKKNGIITLKK